MLSCMISLYIWDINPLSRSVVCKLFLPFCKFPFHFCWLLLLLCIALKFDAVPLINFWFYYALGVILKKSLLRPVSQSFVPTFNFCVFLDIFPRLFILFYLSNCLTLETDTALLQLYEKSYLIGHHCTLLSDIGSLCKYLPLPLPYKLYN